MMTTNRRSCDREEAERLESGARIADALERLGLDEAQACAGAIPGPDGAHRAEEVRGALGVYRRHEARPSREQRETAERIDRNLERITS